MPASSRPSRAWCNGKTLFARLQQFAGRVYGPVIAQRPRLVERPRGQLLGPQRHHPPRGLHRAPPACRICRGKPPFGGHILSHDFVEAALIRRAGWTVMIADDLDGSYEESAALDHRLRRPRPPLVPGQPAAQRVSSRPRAALGEPLPSRHRHLLLSRVAALASPDRRRAGAGGAGPASCRPTISRSAYQLFPTWPQVDPELELQLLGFTALLLFGPKLIGLLAMLRDANAPPAVGWRLSPDRELPVRGRAVGADRADHDADPVGRRRLDPASAATAAGSRSAATTGSFRLPPFGIVTAGTWRAASCSPLPPGTSRRRCSRSFRRRWPVWSLAVPISALDRFAAARPHHEADRAPAHARGAGPARDRARRAPPPARASLDRRGDPGHPRARPRRLAPAASHLAWSIPAATAAAAKSIRSRRSPPPSSAKPAPSTKRSPISARTSRQWRWRRRILFERLSLLSQGVDRPAA